MAERSERGRKRGRDWACSLRSGTEFSSTRAFLSLTSCPLSPCGFFRLFSFFAAIPIQNRREWPKEAKEDEKEGGTGPAVCGAELNSPLRGLFSPLPLALSPRADSFVSFRSLRPSRSRTGGNGRKKRKRTKKREGLDLQFAERN